MWSYWHGQTAEREDRAFAAVSGDVGAIPQPRMAGGFQYFKHKKPSLEVT